MLPATSFFEKDWFQQTLRNLQETMLRENYNANNTTFTGNPTLRESYNVDNTTFTGNHATWKL